MILEIDSDGFRVISAVKTMFFGRNSSKSIKIHDIRLWAVQERPRVEISKISKILIFSTKWSGGVELCYRRCFQRFSESKHYLETCRKPIFDNGSYFFALELEKSSKMLKSPYPASRRLQERPRVEMSKISKILIFQQNDPGV